MKLYIMRHSETDWNRQHRIQGQTDVHLNISGMQIAAMAGDGMKDVPIDVCFSSPLVRAQETAALVVARNRRFLEKGSRIILDDRLKEICFGEWEGLDGSDSSMGMDREQFREFFTNLDSTFRPEGAERPVEVIRRSQEFLEYLLSREDLADKSVLVVSHGFTIRCTGNGTTNASAGMSTGYISISDGGLLDNVKVIGVPSDFFGEEVGACVKLKDSADWDEAAVKQALTGSLAKFKIPAYFVIYDEFPMLGTGKIDVVTLKRDALSRLGKN